MTNWEKEKAYSAKRAEQLANIMEAAIAEHDQSKFDEAFKASMRYMKKRERMEYMKRFIMNGQAV